MSGTKEKQSQSTTRESPIRILDPDGQSFAVSGRNQHLQALSLALLGNYKLILPLKFNTWCREGQDNQAGLELYFRAKGFSSLVDGMMNFNEQIPKSATIRFRGKIVGEYTVREQDDQLFDEHLEGAKKELRESKDPERAWYDAGENIAACVVQHYKIPNATYKRYSRQKVTLDTDCEIVVDEKGKEHSGPASSSDDL